MVSTKYLQSGDHVHPAQLFANVVAEHADAEAIRLSDNSLSYSDLLLKVQQTAFGLSRLGATRGSRIALVLPRSIDQIACVLASSWLGSVFVPVDPSWPVDRIRLILDRLNPTVSVFTNTLVVGSENVPGNGISTSPDQLSVEGAVDTPMAGDGNDPMYIMYTSGSTGVPKGALIPNRGISRLVADGGPIEYGPGTRWLYFGSPAFDGFVLECLVPLLTGSTVVVPSDSPISTTDIDRLIVDQAISHVLLTASVFHIMTDQNCASLGTLSQLVVGGETISPRHCRSHLRRFPSSILINAYGPTEASVIATAHVVTRTDTNHDSGIPIGPPVSGSEVTLLDERCNEVASGQIGELTIGGTGVGLGYDGESQLERQKFVEIQGKSGKWYRTGDRARRRSDGILEFHGRADRQIQIGGHRIELDSIAALGRAHPDVDDAYADLLTDESKGPRIVLLFKTRNPSFSVAAMREWMSSKVLKHEIPGILLKVESIPLLTNGKVDASAALKLASESQPAAGLREPAAPFRSLTPPREIAREAWRKFVADHTPVENSHFADCGGHSLQLIRMLAWLSSSYGISFDMKDFLGNPIFGRLVELIEASQIGPIDSDVATTVLGSGDTCIVCIHGLLSNAKSFEALGSALARRTDGRVRLACIDLWKSARHGSKYFDAEDAKRNLGAVIRSESPAGLLGFSAGGLIPFTADYSEQFPSLHLWLVDPYPPITQPKGLKRTTEPLKNLFSTRSHSFSKIERTCRHYYRRAVGKNAAPEPPIYKEFILKNIESAWDYCRFPWTSTATLITMKDRPLWMPYYQPRSMNGLVRLLGSGTRHEFARGSHSEALDDARAPALASVIADDLDRQQLYQVPGGE